MMSKTTGKTSSRTIFTSLVTVVVVVIAAVVAMLNNPADTPEEPPATPVTVEATPVPVEDTAVPAEDTAVPSETGARLLEVGQGSGAEKDFWQVYFNAPTGSSDHALYVDGIDEHLAAAINAADSTLDIAAFEFNNEVLTQAVLDAHERGLTVRIVTDNEHGLEDEEATLGDFIDAGIPVVDDDRSGLMHNKFMVIDSTVVWMGSMNYTVNGAYRNNNNVLVLRSPEAVDTYQAEFDEMFTDHSFGKRSPAENTANFTQDGVPIQIMFAAENEVTEAIIELINGAENSIHFMAFVLTADEVGAAMQNRIADGVSVSGIFDSRQATTRYSELVPLHCAGGDMRIDGNPYVLHHKVIIIDDHTVLTGSFNFSGNAADTNDENVVIIQEPDIAKLYLEEFERRWAEASVPDAEDLTCE